MNRPKTRFKPIGRGWMKLRDAELLEKYMTQTGHSTVTLARLVGCSRQFIYLLVKGERKSCTELLATRIEVSLGLIPGTLFEPGRSYNTRPVVGSQRTTIERISA